MRKIVFVSPVPLPHSRDLQAGLESLGYSVKCWYLRSAVGYYPWRKTGVAEGEEFVDRDLRKVRCIFRDCDSRTLVVIVGWHSIFQVALAGFCRLKRIPFVYWLDGIEPPPGGPKRRIKGLLLWLADGYFITGRSAISVWKRVYGLDDSRCFDFPYLEHRPDLRDVLKANRERESLINAGAPIRILVSNRFLVRKGYDGLIEGLRSLEPDVLAQIEIDMLGDGPQRSLIEQGSLPETTIRFRGWVEYPEYLEYMQQCDIFIHASLHEPFGIPPLDAMAFGKSVVCSKGVFSGLDRIVHGKNGMLFNPGVAQEICSAVCWLVLNRAEIYRIGQAAQATSLEYGVRYNARSIEKARGELCLGEVRAGT